MKLTSRLVLSAFTALTLVAVPACDKKEDDKAADDKGAGAKAGDDAKADGGGEEAKADGGEEAKADGEAEAEAGEEAKADAGDDAEAEGGEDAAEGGGEVAAGDKIGVPECDDYVVKYTKCIDDELPDPVKETSRKALQTSIDAWKKATATAAGKEGLVQACTTAAEAVKSSCGW